MHCRACNTFLTDFESTRRNANTHDFVDLCNDCFQEVKHIIPVIERKDLMTSKDINDNLDTEGTIEDYNVFEDFKVHKIIND